MGASAVKKSDLPPGFTLDELPEGFTLDPAEAAPEQEPGLFSGPKGNVLDLAIPAAKGFGEGLLSLVDPRAYIGIAKAGYKGATNPSGFLGDVIEVARGMKETGSELLQGKDPKKAAELMGNLATSFVPFGGMMAKAGKYAEGSRAGNVMQALGAGSPGMKAKVEKLVNAGELDLPVSATAGSLREKLGVAKEAALTELKTAKGKLDDLPPASAKGVKDYMAGKRAEQVVEATPEVEVVQPRTPAGFGRETPKPEVKVKTPDTLPSGNPTLRDAIEKQIDEFMAAVDPQGMMKPSQMQKFKEQAQAAAKKEFDIAPGVGKAAAPKGDASKMIAKALKETLENSPDIPVAVRTQLSAANRAYKPLATASELLEQYRLAQSGKPLISRAFAQLTGRGLVGNSLAPLGAAAGIEGAQQLQGVLWNTMSAATKAKVAPYLQSGDLQKAMQIALSAHIAENAARRNQEPTP